MPQSVCSGAPPRATRAANCKLAGLSTEPTPPPGILPAPTGPYRVGLTRELVPGTETCLHVWAPLQSTASGTPAPYLPAAEAAVIQKRYLGDIPVAALTDVESHCLGDVAVADHLAACPTLLSLPGAVGHPASSHSVATDLASHGFAVIGLSAAGDSVVSPGPGRKVVEGRRRRRIDPDDEARMLAERVERWVARCRGVLDSLSRGGPDVVRAVVDPARVGVFGYSLGGAAARSLCAADRRLKAGMNLDGSYYSRTPGEPVHVPFLQLEHEIDPSTLTPRQLALHRELDGAAWEGFRVPAHRMTLEGVSHLSFSDFTLFREDHDPRPPPEVSAVRCSEIVSEAARLFFGVHVAGNAG